MVTNGSLSVTITTLVDEYICDIFFLIQTSEHSQHVIWLGKIPSLTWSRESGLRRES